MIMLPALMLIAAAPPPTAAEIGPAPVAQQAIPMIEQAIRARMIDPDSAKIEWPYDFSAGSLKGLFTKRRTGWITCGMLNSKNRLGGYTGRVYFEVVVHENTIVMLDIGEGTEIDLVGLSCEQSIKSGFLRSVAQVPPTGAATAPPTPDQLIAAAESSAKAAAAQGGVGISLMSSPVGAVLMAVAPGSRAEKAGLKAGETIEAINGIPIKGMDTNSIGAILHSDAPSLAVKVVGVGDLTINR